MKRGDLVRLGIAYALIAASGGTVSAGQVQPKSTANATAAAGAASPAEIPARAWGDIAKSVWVKVGKDRVVAVAAGLTFYAILSLFPAITALVSIYGIFADPGQIQQHLSGLAGVVPDGALSVIGDQIKLISSNGGGTLGVAFVFGLLVALWSANSGMKALFDALNVAYEANESRSFVRLNAISLLFTLSALALTLAGLAGAVVLPWILDNVFSGYAFIATVIRWLTWPIGVAASLLGLAVVYRFGPDREKPLWRWVTPGSIFATLFLIVASAGFAYYASNFGSYNKTYGTLGAAIAFMTWLWISSIVVLVGAELNAETEGQAKGKPPTTDQTLAANN
jgi:membrane protein